MKTLNWKKTKEEIEEFKKRFDLAESYDRGFILGLEKAVKIINNNITEKEEKKKIEKLLMVEATNSYEYNYNHIAGKINEIIDKYESK